MARCERCGKKSGVVATLHFQGGKKTPALCRRCFKRACENAGKETDMAIRDRVDKAKEKLDEARAAVTAVRSELYDLIRGQQLLF